VFTVQRSCHDVVYVAMPPALCPALCTGCALYLAPSYSHSKTLQCTRAVCWVGKTTSFEIARIQLIFQI